MFDGVRRAWPALPHVVKTDEAADHHAVLEKGVERVIAEAHLTTIYIDKADGLLESRNCWARLIDEFNIVAQPRKVEAGTVASEASMPLATIRTRIEGKIRAARAKLATQ